MNNNVNSLLNEVSYRINKEEYDKTFDIYNKYFLYN